MAIANDIEQLTKEYKLNQRNIYNLVFIAYLMKKYNLPLNVEYENFAIFINYLREELSKVIYSKDENDLLLTSLKKLLEYSPTVNLKKIVKFIIKYNREDILEFIRISYFVNSEKSQFDLPDSLSLLVIKLLKIKKGGSFLNMTPYKGNLLTSAIENSIDIEVFGFVENIDDLIDVETRMLLINSRYNIDLLSNLSFYNEETYDGIFFSDINLFNFNIEKKGNLSLKESTSNCWKAVDQIISLMNNKTRVALLLEQNSLYKKSDSQIREYLITNKLVEAIIEIPSELLNTVNKYVLIILSKSNNNLKIMDARKMIVKDENDLLSLDVDEILKSYENPNNDTSIIRNPINIKEKQYSFIPSNYFSNIIDNMKNPALLKGYITIFRGYRGKKEEEAKDFDSCYYIKVGDVENSRIDINNSQIIKYNDKMKKYLLQTGDILVTARGSRFECVLVSTNNKKVICSENFYVIRVFNNEKLNPYYLVVYLNSKMGKEAIFSNQVKDLKLIINPHGLLNTYIELVPINIQKQIEQLYCQKETLLTECKEKISTINFKIDDLLI